MKRRRSQKVAVGKIFIGGGAPVIIQSMTNTDTADVSATAAQILELAAAGAEMVRITVNNEASAKAVPVIKERLMAAGCDAPLAGDFHYNGHLLLTQFPEMAAALDKYRVNPGNVGSGKLHGYNFAVMIECALKFGKPVRIGVNFGSLDRELLTKMMDKNAKSRRVKTDREVAIDALVESALESAKAARKLGMTADRMVLSAKTSDVQDVIAACRQLAAQCDYALHVGLTEAGMGMKGLVASSAALGVLLQEGIGDTIRISLTPEAGEPRSQEVLACQLLLQTMGLRQFRPMVTSCPGCGRTGNELFQQLTKKVDAYVVRRMPEWRRKGCGAENLKIAVMGCVVNGPGEARHADIALSLPGNSEEPMASVFVKGKLMKSLRGSHIGAEFLKILEEFVTRH